MKIRIRRTLPPAAAPLHCRNLMSGFSGLLGGSKIVRKFEAQLKETFSARYCFSVSSGKAALALILSALHDLYPERNEVLIPAYTCYSVPSAIVKAGLKVRLCDISSDSLDFDFELLEEHVASPRLLCLVPIHLFGMPSDVPRIKALFAHRDVFVVEDAAQVMGCDWEGRKLGMTGDVGLFSLGRGKAFSTVEGGIILTNNDLVAQAIEKRIARVPGYSLIDSLRLICYAFALSVFIHPWVFWLPKSLPFLKLGETHFDPSFSIRRLSPFQAGLAEGWQSKIDRLKETRGLNVKRNTEAGIPLPRIYGPVVPSLIRHPVFLTTPQSKRKILHESEVNGLGMSDGYPDSIDGISELEGQFDGSTFPVAKSVAKRIVLLPVHPFVKEQDIQKIASLLRCYG